MTPTYLALIKSIPPPTNLSNIASIPPSTPCTRCSTLLPSRCLPPAGSSNFEPFTLIDHYPSFPALKASSKTCVLCKFLRKTIRSQWAVRSMEEWHSGPLRQGDEMWDEFLDTDWDGVVKIWKPEWVVDEASGMVTGLSLEIGPFNTTVRGDEGQEVNYGEIGQVLSFKVFDSRDMTAENEDHKRRLPSIRTLSPGNLKMIDKLVHDCKSTHYKCQLPKNSHWLPTRLLDVEPEHPRLVDTTAGDIKGPYIALSHMWGSAIQAPPLRTLISNIDQMRLGIEMWKLPENFTQTVIVTRRLGIRYVWIDSLCIIQDSGEDWQKEAKTMHQVYKFAELTIVATSATCSHDGFLARDISIIPAVKYAYPSPTTPFTQESLILSASNDAMDGTWATDIEAIPWNLRGWTMQERSLSMRLLHFSATKIYFECRACIKSEENEPLSTKYSRPFEMWPFSDVLTAGDSPMRKEQEEDLYMRWRRAVSEYTMRGLTKGSDKLTAIASVAAEMSEVVGKDEYLGFAGAWRKMLSVELLWNVRDGVVTRPWEYRAPSWSWASLDGKVGWHERYIPSKSGYEKLMEGELEACNVVVTQETELKNVLRVKGVLKLMSAVRECEHDERWVYGNRGNFPHDVFTAIPTASKTPSSGEPPSHLPAVPAETQSHDAKFLEARLDLDDKDALTRSSKTLGYVHVNSGYRPSGLLLERVMEAENVWKRVGVATVFDRDGVLHHENGFSGDDPVVEIFIV